MTAPKPAGHRQSPRFDLRGRHSAGTSTNGKNLTRVAAANAAPDQARLPAKAAAIASATKATTAASMCPAPATSHTGSGCHA